MITVQNEFNCTDIKDYIIGNRCGTITISVYRETNSGSPIFHIQPDTEDILPICYVIEDVLSVY